MILPEPQLSKKTKPLKTGQHKKTDVSLKYVGRLYARRLDHLHILKSSKNDVRLKNLRRSRQLDHLHILKSSIKKN
jgi:hypothetical protein